MSQVPLAPPSPSKDPIQDRWLYLLWKRISSSGQLLWSYLDFGGSNLADLETRNYSDLQNIPARPVFFPPEDHDDEQLIPGPRGRDGADGKPGMPGMGGEDGEDGLTIPGPRGEQGVPGIPGSPGATGQAGQMIWLEPEPAEEALMIPGPAGAPGSSSGSSDASNLVASSYIVAADTSHVLAGYCVVTSDLTINGNLIVL